LLLPPTSPLSARRPARLFIVSLASSTYDSCVHDATEPTSSHYAADSTRPTDRTGPPSFRTPSLASVEICITRYSMSRRRAARHAAGRRSARPSSCVSCECFIKRIYAPVSCSPCYPPCFRPTLKRSIFSLPRIGAPKFVSVDAANVVVR